MARRAVTTQAGNAVQELLALERLFGSDRLASLLRISPASIQRHRSSTRAIPDHVAARAHFLATVVGDLAGAYNDVGVRRWFGRKRTLLDGKSPAELLKREWNPDDLGPRRVKELAQSLTAVADT